jgi:hypothetical protein
MYECVCVCMYECVHVCMYVCMYVYENFITNVDVLNNFSYDLRQLKCIDPGFKFPRDIQWASAFFCVLYR